MKAQVWSFAGDRLLDVRNCEVAETFDPANPYETTGFALGSNQMIVVEEELFKEDV